MNQQSVGEKTAVDILIWLTGQHEILSAFVSSTGVDPGDIGRLAGSPGFHLALLDFLLEEDARVLAFCQDHAVTPEFVVRARTTLPGGQDPHWT